MKRLIFVVASLVVFITWLAWSLAPTRKDRIVEAFDRAARTFHVESK